MSRKPSNDDVSHAAIARKAAELYRAFTAANPREAPSKAVAAADPTCAKLNEAWTAMQRELPVGHVEREMIEALFLARQRRLSGYDDSDALDEIHKLARNYASEVNDNHELYDARELLEQSPEDPPPKLVDKSTQPKAVKQLWRFVVDLYNSFQRALREEGALSDRVEAMVIAHEYIDRMVSAACMLGLVPSDALESAIGSVLAKRYTSDAAFNSARGLFFEESSSKREQRKIVDGLGRCALRMCGFTEIEAGSLSRAGNS